MRNAKIIGIVGIKGGVGKTTLTANLGYTLSQSFNKKVLLVDANSSTSDLALHLGMLDIKNSLRDVIEGIIPLREAVFKKSNNLFLMSASIKNNSKKLGKLRQYLSALRPYYDFILIDASPSISNEVLASMIAADSLLCVTTPDHPSLSCALTSIKHAQHKLTPMIGLILNKVRNKNFELEMRTIEEITNLPVLAKINYNKHFKKSLSKMKPFTELKQRHYNSKEFFKLAATIAEEPVKIPKKNISKIEINRSLASF